MTGFPVEQVLELAYRIEDYLGCWQPGHNPARGRCRELELLDAVTDTLFSYRHNCQEITGVIFGVSQYTVSRRVTTLPWRSRSQRRWTVRFPSWWR